jgi:hypothetical protein
VEAFASFAEKEQQCAGVIPMIGTQQCGAKYANSPTNPGNTFADSGSALARANPPRMVLDKNRTPREFDNGYLNPPMTLHLDRAARARAGVLDGSAEALAEAFTEVESGKNDARPQLAKALDACRLTGAILVIAKLRLRESRLLADSHPGEEQRQPEVTL